MESTFFEVRFIDFELFRNERMESAIFEVRSIDFEWSR